MTGLMPENLPRPDRESTFRDLAIVQGRRQQDGIHRTFPDDCADTSRLLQRSACCSRLTHPSAALSSPVSVGEPGLFEQTRAFGTLPGVEFGEHPLCFDAPIHCQGFRCVGLVGSGW